MRDSDGLTPKQARWLLEYHLTGNATQAALNTYDTVDPPTASAIAVENLRKPAIIKALQALVEREKLIADGRIMTDVQRKIRLSEIAAEDNPGKFGYQRDPCVRAVDVLNKMDRLYQEGQGGDVTIVLQVNYPVGYEARKEAKQIEAKPEGE